MAPTMRAINRSGLAKNNEAGAYQNIEQNIKQGEKSYSPGSNKNFNDLSIQPSSYKSQF